jgi:hypothetical protein
MWGGRLRHRYERRGTRLIEDAQSAVPVSRSWLLLRVARRLEQSGKIEVAGTCYRQIPDQFPGSPAAAQACARLEALVREEP